MNTAQKLIDQLKNLSPEDRQARLEQMQAQALRDMPDDLGIALEKNPVRWMTNTRTGRRTRVIIDRETGRAGEID